MSGCTQVFTVGHGNRTADEFATVLRAHGIDRVCDVRSFPRSRRWPQFDQAALEAFLPDQGFSYEWLGRELGGFRRTRPDSPHTALEEGFRGYADHMSSDLFRAGLARLEELGRRHAVACLCAEFDWRHCHRRHLADALVARDIAVRHFRDASPPVPHTLDPRARIVDSNRARLIYDVGTQTSFA